MFGGRSAGSVGSLMAILEPLPGKRCACVYVCMFIDLRTCMCFKRDGRLCTQPSMPSSQVCVVVGQDVCARHGPLGLAELAAALDAALPITDETPACDGEVDWDSLDAAADAEGTDDTIKLTPAEWRAQVGTGIWLDHTLSTALEDMAACCHTLEYFLIDMEATIRSVGAPLATPVPSTLGLVARFRLTVQSTVFASPPPYFNTMVALYLLRHFAVFSVMQTKIALNAQIVDSEWWHQRLPAFQQFVTVSQRLHVRDSQPSNLPRVQVHIHQTSKTI
jgi:hypothetical protein